MKVKIGVDFMWDRGDRLPDWEFEVEPGTSRRLTELCPGPGLLVFLRHLA